MNNTSLHWTEDQALLEQFVLGRISGDRLFVLTEHLAVCPQCRAAVDKERDFVRSVRAFGRDQLRSRLKERLERAPANRVPWPHIVSAAAVVVVIVGLGIYNRWWIEPDLMVVSEEGIPAGKAEQGPPPPPAMIEERQGIDPGIQAGKPSAGAGEQPEDETAAGALGKKDVQLDVKIEDDKEVRPSFAEQPAEALADEVRSMGTRSDAGYWIDGVILSVPTGKNLPLAAKREAAAPEARGEEGAAPSRQSAKYLLQQLPGTALPLEQQRKQKGFATIPTKLEPTVDGAVLTAYTDRIDLQNRTVPGNLAGTDSLVFVVNGLRIVYKIPALPAKR